MNLIQTRNALVGTLGLAVLMASCQSSPKSQPEARSQATAPVAAVKIPLPAPWPPAEGGEVWRSETTGKDYRVKIDGDKLYAEWVNLSPIAAENHAYIRTECRRRGAKWMGTSDIFLPCTAGQGANEHIANTCHLKMKVEIDSISNGLIKGRGQTLRKFDCSSCKIVEAGWGNFEWVPASQKVEAKKPQTATKKD